jgi:hypothetical protein
VAYWLALALHLGTPQAGDGYSKLSSLKVPEWLASAEPRARTGERQGKKLERQPQESSVLPYEKLGQLKTY